MNVSDLPNTSQHQHNSKQTVRTSFSTGVTLGLTCRLLVHIDLGRGLGDAGGCLLIRAAFALDGSGREDQLLMTQRQAFKRILLHVDFTGMV